jgi:hypothetical protein
MRNHDAHLHLLDDMKLIFFYSFEYGAAHDRPNEIYDKGVKGGTIDSLTFKLTKWIFFLLKDDALPFRVYE